jgi:hypothetical protein
LRMMAHSLHSPLYACIPAFTPVHPFTPVYQPSHPCTLLRLYTSLHTRAPFYACIPAFTPVHPFTPVYQPSHPFTPLRLYFILHFRPPIHANLDLSVPQFCFPTQQCHSLSMHQSRALAPAQIEDIGGKLALATSSASWSSSARTSSVMEPVERMGWVGATATKLACKHARLQRCNGCRCSTSQVRSRKLVVLCTSCA